MVFFYFITEPPACYNRITFTNSTTIMNPTNNPTTDNNPTDNNPPDSPGGYCKLHGSLLQATLITTLALVVLK